MFFATIYICCNCCGVCGEDLCGCDALEELHFTCYCVCFMGLFYMCVCVFCVCLLASGSLWRAAGLFLCVILFIIYIFMFFVVRSRGHPCSPMRAPTHRTNTGNTDQVSDNTNLRADFILKHIFIAIRNILGGFYRVYQRITLSMAVSKVSSL